MFALWERIKSLNMGIALTVNFASVAVNAVRFALETHLPFMEKVSADELLKDLKENGIHTAVDTCGFVPQFNADEIENIGRFLGEIKNLTRVRVLAYHNFAGSKYEALEMKNTLPEALPENEDLSKAAEKLRKYINREII